MEAESVKCIGDSSVEMYCIKYKNSKRSVYWLCPGIWRPTIVVILTTKGTYQIEPDINKLYLSLLTHVFDSLDNSNIVSDVNNLTDGIKIALAGKCSRECGRIEIKLDDLSINAPGYCGDTFEANYAKSVSL